MSVRLMGAVFELDIAATEKLVLLAMADHARDDGTGCYPSIGRLAKKSSLSRRGVQKVARRLEETGFIIPTANVRGGRNLATEYRITLEKGEQGSLFSPAKGRTPEQERANVSAQKGERGSPQPSGTVIEPKTPLAASQPGDVRHRPFLDFATEAYGAKHGQPPTWSGKDFKTLSELLRRAGSVTLEELQRRFTAYLDSTDPFIVRNGYGLSVFCMRFDALRGGPILRRNGGADGNGKLRGNELLKHNLAAAGFRGPQPGHS